MADYFETGFFVRKPAWHGLGTVTDRYPKNWKEAMKWAGLDQWEAVAAPVFGFEGLRADGKVTYDPATAVSDAAKTAEWIATASRADLAALVSGYMQIEDKQRTLRTDTGKNLGVPGRDYRVIPHAEFGSILSAVADQSGIKVETTVELEGGRSVCACILLDEPVTVGKDKSITLPIMSLHTRHDGLGAMRALATSIRVVCANTRNMAESQADGNATVFTFSHTKNWREHVEEAKLAVRGLRTNFAEYVDFASHLAKIRVTDEQTATFLAAFIPPPLTSIEASDRVIRGKEEARLTVKAILESVTCDGVRGTAMGLVQAGDEYLDWYRGSRSKDTLFTRQLLQPQARKIELVKIVRELVGA